MWGCNAARFWQQQCVPHALRAPSTVRRRIDWVHNTSVKVNFKRIWDAPTMHPDKLVRTLRDLKAEGSSDVFLLRALSQRFRANAEEFFPPQIDDVLRSFAGLRYADDSLLFGFVGRSGDLMANASPRRLVRVLRNAAALHLRPVAWSEQVIPIVHRELPEFREGLPSLLESLHALRAQEVELVDLLAVQGMLVSDELGDAFLARVFERWSRHGYHNEELEGRVLSLPEDVIDSLDIRDVLNLLAGFLRCGHLSAVRALETHIDTVLRGANMNTIMKALSWMVTVSLRSHPLWEACASAVEESLKNLSFRRHAFPDAVHSLAMLISGPVEEVTDELRLVVGFLSSPDISSAIPRYNALQSLKLLHAACLLATRSTPASKAEEHIVQTIPWDTFARQAVRLSRQLNLPNRRMLKMAAEVLRDIAKRYDLDADNYLAITDQLAVVGLPPLVGVADELEDPDEWEMVEVGAEAFLQFPQTGRVPGLKFLSDRKGVKFLGTGDVFANHGEHSQSMTPSCQLVLRAMDLQGWSVEVCA